MHSRSFSLALILAVAGLLSGCEYSGVNSTNYGYETSAGDVYQGSDEQVFVDASTQPVSTFSIDVDHASYTNVRRFINEGQKPPTDAVRIEEMVNYFKYDLSAPENDDVVKVSTDLLNCPWNPEHRLIHIGLRGKAVSQSVSPASNLVFLIDCSGSMASSDRLDLLKQSFKVLTNQLRTQDRVAIVSYAESITVVLNSTSGSEKSTILQAIDQLQAGGGTNGGAGIQKAYEIALANSIPGGVNRVILATDGDFNVGITSTDELLKFVEEQRSKGITLTCLGVGRGNLHDARMEKLADNGDGNYYYLDGIEEANRVLASELAGTIITIARDVKVQATFDAAAVKSYRLIGYDNRRLTNSQFNNDSTDAGDLGADEEVTAFYEIIPTSANLGDLQPVMKFDVRYKRSAGAPSELISTTLKYSPLNQQSLAAMFAASVVEFGLILRDSKFKAQASLDSVIQRATTAKGLDPTGERQEFIDLVRRYQQIK